MCNSASQYLVWFPSFFKIAWSVFKFHEIIFSSSSPGFFRHITNSCLDVCYLLFLSVKTISHNNVEVRTTGRPIHDWRCSSVCPHVLYCTGSALGSLLLLKNEADVGQMALHSGSNLMVFFWIHNSISFDNITGWKYSHKHNRWL